MPKRRINIEIKPCCSNCKENGNIDCKNARTNPCRYYTPAYAWFGNKLDAAEKKLDKAAKAAKKPKPRHEEDEFLDVYVGAEP